MAHVISKHVAEGNRCQMDGVRILHNLLDTYPLISSNIHRAGKRIPYQSLVTEVQEVLFWLNHLDDDTWDEAQDYDLHNASRMSSHYVQKVFVSLVNGHRCQGTLKLVPVVAHHKDSWPRLSGQKAWGTLNCIRSRGQIMTNLESLGRHSPFMTFLDVSVLSCIIMILKSVLACLLYNLKLLSVLAISQLFTWRVACTE